MHFASARGIQSYFIGGRRRTTAAPLPRRATAAPNVIQIVVIVGYHAGATESHGQIIDVDRLTSLQRASHAVKLLDKLNIFFSHENIFEHKKKFAMLSGLRYLQIDKVQGRINNR